MSYEVFKFGSATPQPSPTLSTGLVTRPIINLKSGDNTIIEIGQAVYYFAGSPGIGIDSSQDFRNRSVNVPSAEITISDLIEPAPTNEVQVFLYYNKNIASYFLSIENPENYMLDQENITYICSVWYYVSQFEFHPLTLTEDPFLFGSEDGLRNSTLNPGNGFSFIPDDLSLSFGLGSGSWVFEGGRYPSRINENTRSFTEISVLTFKYVSPSPWGNGIPSFPITGATVDPTRYYDPSSGGAETVPPNKWTIQLIFKTRKGNHGIVYGQTLYNAVPKILESLNYVPNLKGVPYGSLWITALALKQGLANFGDTTGWEVLPLPRILKNRLP